MKQKTIKKVYIDLLVIVLGFAVLAYLFKFPWLLIGSGIALLSAVHPTSARMVSSAWENIGKFLGKINSTILLTVFFITIISPLAGLYRLTKRKKMGNGNWQNADEKAVDFTRPY